MKKFKCTVCGYIHEGDSAPEKCPLCKVPAEKFVELEESAEISFVDEHGVTRYFTINYLTTGNKDIFIKEVVPMIEK